jgi:hypothetical protein
MKTNLWNGTSWKLIILAALSVTACKQAGYEVLKPGLLNGNDFGDPKTMAPTARVEVIDRGVSVTWVYAGTHVDIRPSADTLDGDYIGKETFENPGIIAADYDLGNKTTPTVTRVNGSTLAALNQVYTTPGDYLVKMTVKSKDNEQAIATMTLRVVDKSVPASQIEGGFTIHAKPILVELNKPVTLTGICELKGRLTISWNYADSATGAGAVTQHSYSKIGSYLVNATCASDSSKKMTASLTVVVVAKAPPSIPEVAVPVPSNNPNLPKTPSCDPTQGPCQNAGQIPNGSQTVPNSSAPVWYYDPYCACYTPA